MYSEWDSFHCFLATVAFFTFFVRPKMDMAEAMFDYTPQHVGDLALKVGDKVEVVRKGDDGWWSGTLRGQQGNFPGWLSCSTRLYFAFLSRTNCIFFFLFFLLIIFCQCCFGVPCVGGSFYLLLRILKDRITPALSESFNVTMVR